MRRRWFTSIPIAALLAVAMLSAAILPARAATIPNPGPYEKLMSGLIQIGYGDTGGVNCAVLRGTPFLCIKNQASAPVVAVQVVNIGSPFAPNSWIDMGYFGGPIPPGGATVAKFSTYGSGCQKLLFVRLASGQSHPFSLDVCHAASIVVNGW